MWQSRRAASRATVWVAIYLSLAAVVTVFLPRTAGARATAVLRFTGQLIDRPDQLRETVDGLLQDAHLSTGQRTDLIGQAAACDAGSEQQEQRTKSQLLQGSLQIEGSDASGEPDKTQNTAELSDRLRALFHEQLGYCVGRVVRKGGEIEVTLRRFRVVRQVEVTGNWPIFEEDLLSRLQFRVGQQLPEGKELAASIARQDKRLKRFLSRRGYFDGHIETEISSADRVGLVDVHVRVHKGRSYKVGEVRILPMTGFQPTSGKSWQPAIPRKQIESLFREKVLFYRRTFTTDRFNKAVKALTARYHALGYPGVRIEPSYEVDTQRPSSEAVRITLRIHERKQIKIKYAGNASLSNSTLNEALTLYEAGAYDDYELAQSAEQIHRLYQSKGYLQARVRFSRQVGAKRDIVTFEIDEGPRMRVEEVRFFGNDSISDDDLRGVVRSRPYPLLGLGSGGYCTNTQLQQDIERIIDYYHAHGFPRIRVTGHLAPNAALIDRPGALAAALGTGAAQHGELYIRFDIQEGRQMRVGRIELEGTHALDRSFLLSKLNLAPGKPFTPALLTEDKKRIVRLYAERGYPYATIETMEETDANETQVEVLNLRVVEGKVVHFGPIFLRGNLRTRDGVILKLLDISPGDRFDIRKLEQSERNLRQLGIFDSVRTQVLGVAAKLDQVPILVRVEERHDDYGAIEVGVGGSTDNLFFGSVGYDWRNAFGLGLGINLHSEFGPQIQSGNLNLLYPRPLGSKLDFELRLFMRNELTERLGALFTLGGAFSVSRQLLSHLRAVVSYEIRIIRADETLNRPSAPFDEASTDRVESRTGSLSSTLLYDRRDNPIAPSKGFSLSGTFIWAAKALAGTDDFLKIRLNGQAYIPLPFDMTIAMGVRYDHGIPLGGAAVLPRAERFFAGGDTTVRGFEEDRAFAELIQEPLSPLTGASAVRLIPQGGNIRILTNIEFQFPIWRESILLGLPLLGAVFLDNGVVTDSLEALRLADFRQGAGVALRIVTLVGFLSLEYAWPLDPNIGDPRDGRFHFNFGFIF